MSESSTDEFVLKFREKYRNGWDYAVYTPTPHIYAIIERMEKAEARVRELESDNRHIKSIGSIPESRLLEIIKTSDTMKELEILGNSQRVTTESVGEDHFMSSVEARDMTDIDRMRGT
jgi:hypothetical protein